MSIARHLAYGLRNMIRRKRADEDIADEVDSFLAESKADWEARGLMARDAVRAARMELGSNTALREEVRSFGWENVLNSIFQDVKYTLGRLRSAPSFTFISIATLALGRGATTAIFSVINGILLKPLPYPDSGRLVSLWMTAPGLGIADLSMAPAIYFTVADEKRAFEAVSMWTGGSISVSGKGHPEQPAALFAAHEFLPILWIKAAAWPFVQGRG